MVPASDRERGGEEDLEVRGEPGSGDTEAGGTGDSGVRGQPAIQGASRSPASRHRTCRAGQHEGASILTYTIL